CAEDGVETALLTADVTESVHHSWWERNCVPGAEGDLFILFISPEEHPLAVERDEHLYRRMAVHRRARAWHGFDDHSVEAFGFGAGRVQGRTVRPPSTNNIEA